MAVSSPYPHVVVHPCMSVSQLSFYRDTSHIGVEPTIVTLFYLHHLLKDPSAPTHQLWGAGGPGFPMRTGGPWSSPSQLGNRLDEEKTNDVCTQGTGTLVQDCLHACT